MHPSAMFHGQLFFDTYVEEGAGLTIVDIGAQDVNGSLRSVAPAGSQYVGVDFQTARGVDVVIPDPYSLPFDDGSIDVCVSSSCFEHSEFFWLSFLEILRVLKPTGLAYLNVPSNGPFHRYPVDCWRFYPDSGLALQNWGRRNGFPVALLESFVGEQKDGPWNDFIGVFVADQANAGDYPRRIQSQIASFTNGWTIGQQGFANPAELPEDQRSMAHSIKGKVQRLLG